MSTRPTPSQPDRQPLTLPATLRRIFAAYRRRWRWVSVQRGVLVTLGVVLAIIGIAVAADRLLRLTAAPRLVALVIVIAAALAALAVWVLRPLLRRMRDRDAALHLAHHYPQVGEDLLSAVELTSNGAGIAGASRELVDRAVQQIADRAQPQVNPKRAVHLRALGIAAAGCALLMLVMTAAYVAQPEAVSNALQRLLQPTADVPFFSYTKLQVQPGDHVVRVGDSAAIEVALAGRVPSRTLLEASSGSAPLRQWLDARSGAAAWQSAPLVDDLVYRVRGGDALSPWYRIRVLPPPALGSRSAVIVEPDYAGGNSRTVDRLNGALEVIEGSRVMLRLVPERRAGVEAAITGALTIGDAAAALEASADGTLLSPAFTPRGKVRCTILLRDALGLESRAPETLHVHAVPDRVPQVRIIQPARDLVVLPNESVEVQAVAEDEFGIRSLVLAHRFEPKPEEREKSVDPAWQQRTLADGGQREAELQGKSILDIRDLGAVAGDIIEYRAQAADYADDTFLRTGHSAAFRIIVISETEHLHRILALLRDQQVNLLRQAAREKGEADALAELAEKAAEESMRAPAHAAAQRQDDIKRQSRKIADDLDAILAEAARNPSSPASLLGSLERLSRDVRGVAEGSVSEAQQNASEASLSEGEGQASSLQSASGSATRAAEQFKSLADVAERLQRQTLLEKLAAEAERLAQQVAETGRSAAHLAVQMAGRQPQELEHAVRDAWRRLTSTQQDSTQRTGQLEHDIHDAQRTLAFTQPNDAALAREAGQFMEDKTVHGSLEAIGEHMVEGVLFVDLPRHEQVSDSLLEVASILRRRAEDPIEAMEKELERFIRRQKEINSSIAAMLAKQTSAPSPPTVARDQALLSQEVGEQASAIFWLANELDNFEPRTAGALAAASVEMENGATDLLAVRLQDGHEHGKAALALLLEARQAFEEERDQLAEACQAGANAEAALLLQKIIIEQKRINSGTLDADGMAAELHDDRAQKLANLASRQGGVRQDAGRLRFMLPPQIGPLLDEVDKRMETSRTALAAGDSGEKTRQVQRQVIVLLEELLKQCSGGGSGLAQARLQALMGMMAAGASGGGFTGGANAAVLPRGGTSDDAQWRTLQSRFEDELSTGADVDYPPAFRALLHAYFDRLRQEPPQ